MSFAASDIILSAQPGSPVTWVSFPYAAGAPEIMRNVGGRWDKMASAWGVPMDRMDDLRQRLPQIAKLVFLQQEIDRGNGRTPKPSPTAPAFRSAAIPVPVTVVGNDWIPLPTPDSLSAKRAITDIGCAKKVMGGIGVFYAPDQTIADQALAVIQSFADAEILQAAAAADAREKSRAAERIETLRLKALADIVRPVFGEYRYDNPNLAALAEIAPVWGSVKFQSVESRLLDGNPGPPSIQVRTPSGREVSVGHLLKTNTTKISRRVDLIERMAPRFPPDSGFKVTVTTSQNGKYYTRELLAWKPQISPEGE